MQPPLLSSKPHYPILDGLRGVAAVMVVMFHLFEAHASSHAVQIINHGYLAVDFFFVLSGFVIGYAYDDQWGKMSYGNFFKRRLIRLHPMVVMGMVIGAVCYYMGADEIFPIIKEVPVWRMLLIMFLGCLMIPVPTNMDIRGWNETFPLNGASWSLFFEYIANILYALIIRRFSKKLLSLIVFIAACFLIHWAITSPAGDVAGGWSLEPDQLRIGFTRLIYPFFAGLLLFRIGKLVKVKRSAFWICSLIIVCIMAMPRIGGEELWLNGLYESLCIILLFPLIVSIGAGSSITGKYSPCLCKFLGDISYPLYITHYPMVYIYTGWVIQTQPSWQMALLWGAIDFAGSFALAYICLKYYDEPVRRWLKKRFL